jgi:hypothetical protein
MLPGVGVGVVGAAAAFSAGKYFLTEAIAHIAGVSPFW